MPERELVPGLAALLKARREAAGLSQVEAEMRSGVHRISITRFETGKREPSIATLYQLAAAYGVAVAEMLPPGGIPTPADEPAPAPAKPPRPKKSKDK